MSDADAPLALIDEVIARLSLDLRGLVVLTEAATGAFAVSATLAARAGAERVMAVTRDSSFGRARDAERETLALANIAGVADRITVHTARESTPYAACDVVTNLGFVRPIDATLIAQLKPTAVIALMCEAWEFRAGDLDLEACAARGITVLATNEHAPTLPVFAHCGALGVQLLTDAGVAVDGARVTVVGRDPFTPVLAAALQGAGALVRADTTATTASLAASLVGADTVLVAEYAQDDIVLGDGGRVSAALLSQLAPGARVVQFAGAIHEQSLVAHGVSVWPSPPVPPHRMSRTLAHLGPRPVVELHAAGMHGASFAARARLAGHSPADAVALACTRCDVAQSMDRSGTHDAEERGRHEPA